MTLSRSWGKNDSRYAISYSQSDTRIHSLDGLHAVAIALAVAGHFTKINLFPGGFGVTVFFVVSGFLITHLLLKELDRTGTIDLMAFYKRRVSALAGHRRHDDRCLTSPGPCRPGLDRCAAGVGLDLLPAELLSELPPLRRAAWAALVTRDRGAFLRRAPLR